MKEPHFSSYLVEVAEVDVRLIYNVQDEIERRAFIS
jgi:hypothetical protein